MPRLLLILALIVAAGSGRSGALAATTGDRVVNFYNWSDYIDPAAIEAFTRETGIAVKYDIFDSNDILETKLLAGNSGYDVVVPTAYFLERQIKAGIFRKLDKPRLPNLANVWDEIARRLAAYDPGNLYAVNYMWGTTGIGYNVGSAKAILGAQATLDSWDLVFKPEAIAKFKACGVHMLDSSDDVLSAALNYLGLDPNTSEQAQKRAGEAKNGVDIGYVIPKEGAQLWFDNLAIPRDARHPAEAHALIDFLLRPEIAAKNTNL